MKHRSRGLVKLLLLWSDYHITRACYTKQINVRQNVVACSSPWSIGWSCSRYQPWPRPHRSVLACSRDWDQVTLYTNTFVSQSD